MAEAQKQRKQKKELQRQKLKLAEQQENEQGKETEGLFPQIIRPAEGERGQIEESKQTASGRHCSQAARCEYAV